MTPFFFYQIIKTAESFACVFEWSSFALELLYPLVAESLLYWVEVLKIEVAIVVLCLIVAPNNVHIQINEEWGWPALWIFLVTLKSTFLFHLFIVYKLCKPQGCPVHVQDAWVGWLVAFFCSCCCLGNFELNWKDTAWRVCRRFNFWNRMYDCIA